MRGSSSVSVRVSEWSVVVEVARAGGGVDAGLDLDGAALAGDGGGDLAVAEVADAALASSAARSRSRCPSGTRSASGRRRPRRRRGSGWRRRRSTVRPSVKATVPPSPGSTRAVRNCSVNSSRPLSAWNRSSASSSPAGPHANVRRSARSGTSAGSSSTSRTPWTSSYRATSRIAPAAASASRSREEDRVGPARRDVDDGDVEVGAPARAQHALVGGREEVAQHADDRGDAGAGGDEEEPATLGRQHELAGRLLEVDQGAGAGAVDEVVADQPVGDGLDRDRDPAVGPRAVGQRVGAPLADAVDVDADPEVLARDVAGPVGAGPDHQRGRVAGLGDHLLDPAAQVGPGAQRGEEVEEVGRHQRRRGRLGQSTHARPQCCS